MGIHITAEDIERADRLNRNPYDSDHVWHTIDAKPVVSDDGLFNHRGEYVPCSGCQPESVTGDGLWVHGHIVVEGSNGGVRCEPLTDESFRRFVRDMLFPTPNGMAIDVGHADAVLGLAISIAGSSSAVRVLPTVTESAAEEIARDGADALDRLIAGKLLFADADGER